MYGNTGETSGSHWVRSLDPRSRPTAQVIRTAEMRGNILPRQNIAKVITKKPSSQTPTHARSH